jgi:class 3 adenylate cyclase
MILHDHGEEKTVVALFSDIRGFSHMFEKIPAEKVYMFTNRFFTKTSEIIAQYRGNLDNIVGDGLLAIWGEQQWFKNAPFFAVRAALEIRMALLRQNIQYKWESHFPLEIGIGLAMGEALHCRVGPREKAIDTFFGSPVILASRLGNEARHNRILVDQATAHTINRWSKVEKLPPRELRGFTKKITAFNVAGLMDFSRKNGERRKSSFIRYVFPEIVALVFKKNGIRRPVILRNISSSGAGIEIVDHEDYQPLQNDEIALDLKSFKLPHFTELDGRIVQIRPISEESDVERSLSQIGIQFTGIDTAKQKVLQHLNIS